MVARDIKNAHIADLLNAFDYLRNLPFISKEAIGRYCTHIAEQDLVMTMFGSTRLGERGQTVGVASPEDSIRINAYRRYRLSYRCIIEKTISEVCEHYTIYEDICFHALYENYTATYY